MRVTWRRVSLAFFFCAFAANPQQRPPAKGPAAPASADPNWIELDASMERMHHGMAAVARTGNPDEDFVRLMLPHHQGAIDMAKAELLYGKDPAMRRLAQEILTDQQLEIDVMNLWLKNRPQGSARK